MLTIRLYSFSYLKTGIPADPTGHGGGFVFDCRCLPNPGRLEKYASLTGHDDAVARWLKEQPIIGEFLEATERIVRLAIPTYLERGFEDLFVAFGCTGGQHRSVYCAEWMARRLAGDGISATVTHLMQPT
jgi:RNase adaptor protein for sRNA GlmZ degradation